MADFLDESGEIQKHGTKLPHWQQGEVMQFVTFRLGEEATDTLLFVPLNTNAPPFFPCVVHATVPWIVPVFAFPARSTTVVPVPSSNEYAATRPGMTVAAGVVALPVLENAPGLPAASTARTR